MNGNAFSIHNAPVELFPHGLHAHGHSQLLVVNHKSNEDAIEFFDVDFASKTLSHAKSFSHELLFNVNDCATHGSTMYCTNWRSQKTGTVADMAEVYLRLPWTNVVKCDLESGACDEAAVGLKMANGVEISRDGSFLFVVESVRPAIAVFSISASDGTLELSHRIPTLESCDNLSWDSAGNLLSGCHPKALTWLWYCKDVEARHAPCTVKKIASPPAKPRGERRCAPRRFRQTHIRMQRGCHRRRRRRDNEDLVGAVRQGRSEVPLQCS